MLITQSRTVLRNTKIWKWRETQVAINHPRQLIFLIISYLSVLNQRATNLIVGGITENNNDQMYESLRSLQKIRDEIVCYMSSLLFQSKWCMFPIKKILVEKLMWTHRFFSLFQIHNERILQERCIQCDMDIQTILNGTSFLGAIHFQKFYTKLWCGTLFIAASRPLHSEVARFDQKLYQFHISSAHHV
jgi:hypothetical protein